MKIEVFLVLNIIIDKIYKIILIRENFLSSSRQGNLPVCGGF